MAFQNDDFFKNDVNNRFLRSIEDKNDFLAWQKKNGLVLFQNLSDVVETDRNLHAGQYVTFVNSDGVHFPNYEILGFTDNIFYGRCAYLNKDSWWFPVRPESLNPQSGLIGIDRPSKIA